MLELRRHLGLGDEATQQGGVAAALVLEALDRDRALERRLGAEEHLSHAAPSEQGHVGVSAPLERLVPLLDEAHERRAIGEEVAQPVGRDQPPLAEDLGEAVDVLFGEGARALGEDSVGALDLVAMRGLDVSEELIEGHEPTLSRSRPGYRRAARVGPVAWRSHSGGDLDRLGPDPGRVAAHFTFGRSSS